VIRYEKQAEPLSDHQKELFFEQFGEDIEANDRPQFLLENLSAVKAFKILEKQLLLSPMGKIIGLDMKAVFEYCRFANLDQDEAEILIKKLKVIEEELYFTDNDGE